MPGAVIVADQPTGAGSGVPGTARNDLWLSQPVLLSVATSGNSTYEWELIDKPPGSSTALGTPKASTSDFTPDLVGTYRIRLITNGGGAGNIQILVFRVRYNSVGALADRGWALPGLGEAGTTENNYGGNARGYDQVLRAIFADLLPWAAGLNVLVNGALVGQRRTLNVVGSGLALSEDIPNDRLDLTFKPYFEIPFVAGTRSTSAEAPGEVVGARQLNIPLLPAGTRHFYLVATLVSTTAAAITHVELWNVTRNYMVANGALNNNDAADVQIAQTFISSELTQGTLGSTLRTNSNDEYELRLYGADGAPGDFVSLLNGHLRVTYD